MTWAEAVARYGEDGAREYFAYRSATPAERRAVIEGPDACEHPDRDESGRCLECGADAPRREPS